jgi:hypothetical protein
MVNRYFKLNQRKQNLKAIKAFMRKYLNSVYSTLYSKCKEEQREGNRLRIGG